MNERGENLVFGNTTSKDEQLEREQLLEWFYCAARGDSLAKQMQGILNKKEVHWFLRAPDQNSVCKNLFWAKCRAAAMPEKICNYVVEDFCRGDWRNRLGSRIDSIVNFYAANWMDMGRWEVYDINFFILDMLSDPKFSLQGRSLKSICELTIRWRQGVHVGSLTKYQSWRRDFDFWEVKRNGLLVQVGELTSNRELAVEGRIQRHCVFTYTSDCINGASRIFSMRFKSISGDGHIGEELSRLTIEIDPRMRQVVQVRGRLNSIATADQEQWLKRWAADHGLKLCDYN
ncbi:MAG: PcfJ domain-containing protein [Fimbriimonadaceae bacterium]|nr:PcfJ domain-containing protein [Fimbriimonadaceae bacterium]